MDITFIQTGGTIDKDYPRKTGGYAFEITTPAIRKIMKKINAGFSYDIITAFRKDSMEITAGDREKLLDICRSLSSQVIIITHGTDTMIETALFLEDKTGKLIILTGSSLPEKFQDSDASFNAGLAIGAANCLEKGVYIAMNGLIIPAKACVRDMKRGVFYNKQER